MFNLPCRISVPESASVERAPRERDGAKLHRLVEATVFTHSATVREKQSQSVVTRRLCNICDVKHKTARATHLTSNTEYLKADERTVSDRPQQLQLTLAGPQPARRKMDLRGRRNIKRGNNKLN